MLRRIACVSLLMLIVSCSERGPIEQDDSGNLIPRPKTIEELTQRTKLIVIGTIIDVQRQASEGPIGTQPGTGNAPPLPGIAFTYYTVTADSIVAGTEVAPGEEFTLRVNGSAKEKTQSGGEMLMPQPGDTRLFVLETDPLVPEAYFPAPWGIFDVSGPTAKFDDVDGTSVQQFTSSSSRSAFTDALRAAVDRRP